MRITLEQIEAWSTAQMERSDGPESPTDVLARLGIENGDEVQNYFTDMTGGDPISGLAAVMGAAIILDLEHAENHDEEQVEA